MPAGKPYHFHPEAWVEFETAESWYRLRNPEAAVNFLAAVYDALEDIAQWPHAWQDYLHGTRKFVLQRFPYLIVYREKESSVEILRSPTVTADPDIGNSDCDASGATPWRLSSPC